MSIQSDSNKHSLYQVVDIIVKAKNMCVNYDNEFSSYKVAEKEELLEKISRVLDSFSEASQLAEEYKSVKNLLLSKHEKINFFESIKIVRENSTKKAVQDTAESAAEQIRTTQLALHLWTPYCNTRMANLRSQLKKPMSDILEGFQALHEYTIVLRNFEDKYGPVQSINDVGQSAEEQYLRIKTNYDQAKEILSAFDETENSKEIESIRETLTEQEKFIEKYESLEKTKFLIDQLEEMKKSMELIEANEDMQFLNNKYKMMESMMNEQKSYY